MKTLTAAELADIKLRILAIQDEPILELEFDPADLECDLEADFSEIPAAPPRTPCDPALTPTRPIRVTGSKKISIRIPQKLLAALRAKARQTGIGYQTIIIKTLKAAASGWGSV